MIFLRQSDIDIVFRDKLALDVSNNDPDERDRRYAKAEKWAIEMYSEILRTHYDIAVVIAGSGDDTIAELLAAQAVAQAALDAALAVDPQVPADVEAATLAYALASTAVEDWYAARNQSLVHWLAMSTVYLYITSVDANVQPEFYETQHEKGLAWAMRCAKGEISPDFPNRKDAVTGDTLAQPATVRFGKSNHKRSNYLPGKPFPDPLNP